MSFDKDYKYINFVREQGMSDKIKEPYVGVKIKKSGQPAIPFWASTDI